MAAEKVRNTGRVPNWRALLRRRPSRIRAPRVRPCARDVDDGCSGAGRRLSCAPFRGFTAAGCASSSWFAVRRGPSRQKPGSGHAAISKYSPPPRRGARGGARHRCWPPARPLRARSSCRRLARRASLEALARAFLRPGPSPWSSRAWSAFASEECATTAIRHAAPSLDLGREQRRCAARRVSPYVPSTTIICRRSPCATSAASTSLSSPQQGRGPLLAAVRRSRAPGCATSPITLSAHDHPHRAADSACAPRRFQQVSGYRLLHAGAQASRPGGDLFRLGADGLDPDRRRDGHGISGCASLVVDLPDRSPIAPAMRGCRTGYRDVVEVTTMALVGGTATGMAVCPRCWPLALLAATLSRHCPAGRSGRRRLRRRGGLAQPQDAHRRRCRTDRTADLLKRVDDLARIGLWSGVARERNTRRSNPSFGLSPVASDPILNLP